MYHLHIFCPRLQASDHAKEYFVKVVSYSKGGKVLVTHNLSLGQESRITIYYINSNEIPGELCVKTSYLHT